MMAKDLEILKEYIHESLSELKLGGSKKKSGGFLQKLLSGLKSTLGVEPTKKSSFVSGSSSDRARASQEFRDIVSDWIEEIELLEDTELDPRIIDKLTKYAQSVYIRTLNTYRGNLRKAAEMTKRALDIQYAKLQR